MKDLLFHEQAIDTGTAFHFEPTLFHNASHLRLQRAEGWRWYCATHERHGRVVSSLYLNISGTIATSAVRSPFGAIECSPDILPESLYNFLVFVGNSLQDTGVSTVRIKHSPQAYAPRTNSLIAGFLPNLGYAVIDAELSSIFTIGDGFMSGLDRTERGIMQKATDAGLLVHLLPLSKLKIVYQFILDCHQLKSYVLSMNYEDLALTVEHFPERFVVSAVFDNDNMVAASIAIRISSTVLYNFYMDHHPSYDKLSPVLLLTENLYNYCRDNNIQLLDLGTSSVEGKPNFPLLAFKLQLGSQPSPKLIYEKVL